MKALPAFLFFLLGVVSLQAATSPAPEMTISFPLNRDPRIWRVADTLTNGPVGSFVVITREWVPKGDSIKAWKEMFDEQTILTKGSVRNHIDGWKAMFAKVDPKAEIKEEKNADGTITVTYTSIAGGEMGVSRHFKASDGIYILSYRVRPKLKNEETMQIWRIIISSATLVSSHERKED